MQYAHTHTKTLNAALLLHYYFTLPFKGLLSVRFFIFNIVINHVDWSFRESWRKKTHKKNN